MKILTTNEVKELSQSFINIINILTPSVNTTDYQETVDKGLANFGHMLELSQKATDAANNPE